MGINQLCKCDPSTNMAPICYHFHSTILANRGEVCGEFMAGRGGGAFKFWLREGELLLVESSQKIIWFFIKEVKIKFVPPDFYNPA